MAKKGLANDPVPEVRSCCELVRQSETVMRFGMLLRHLPVYPIPFRCGGTKHPKLLQEWR
jgi:hypothetical protein